MKARLVEAVKIAGMGLVISVWFLIVIFTVMILGEK